MYQAFKVLGVIVSSEVQESLKWEKSPLSSSFLKGKSQLTSEQADRLSDAGVIWSWAFPKGHMYKAWSLAICYWEAAGPWGGRAEL